MTNAPAGTKFFRQLGVALAVVAILTIYGVEAHGRRERLSTPATLGDQGAYLAYARQMYETKYAVIGDRNRMPVFPFLLSLVYKPGMSEEQFLKRAQVFNINLSIALLLLLFVIFRRYFPPLYAVGLLCATAFGVFLYRAINAQTEVLFYSISFCAFVLLLQMLLTPRWRLAVMCGAIVGLAHLTKASVLPALGIWLCVFCAQIVWRLRTHSEEVSGNGWRLLGMLMVVIATFLAVVFPYIRTSAKIYGQFFYNVNSNFVMWCDSSSEGWEFLNEYGDKAKWRSLPADQLPSAGKYWREHSITQMAGRVMRGLGDLAHLKVQAIGYYKFAVLFAFTGFLLWVRKPRLVQKFLAEKPFAAAFCLLFLAAYVLLYAWYGAIVKDTRFILSIFLPLVFAASLFVVAMGRDRSIMFAHRQYSLMNLFSGTLVGLALIDVCYNGIRSFV